METRKEKLEQILQILKEKGNHFMANNVQAELDKLNNETQSRPHD